jgi:hypothetical protein
MPHTAGCNLALKNSTATRVLTARGYLRVTDDDFAKAADVAKVMTEGYFSRKQRLGF